MQGLELHIHGIKTNSNKRYEVITSLFGSCIAIYKDIIALLIDTKNSYGENFYSLKLLEGEAKAKAECK